MYVWEQGIWRGGWKERGENSEEKEVYRKREEGVGEGGRDGGMLLTTF